MIIVSALDNSGQKHAADLVDALRETLVDETFVGIGGRDLAHSGCELVHDISDNSAMLTGVIGALRWAVPAYRKLLRLMDAGQVKLVILVDSPTFNLPLAKAARKRGIKTFYYVAPQVWAWAQFRVRRIKARVDRLAVILPFEEQYFRDYGIDAHFVGHPFIHQIKQSAIDVELERQLNEVGRTSKRILLMPGSRGHEIEQILPAQLRILRSVSNEIGGATPFIAAWPKLADKIRDIVRDGGFESVDNSFGKNENQIGVFTENKATLIANADLTLVASGTAILEVGWHGRPMIVMYNASRFMYHLIARWLINTPYLSLVNILANRELVPEFMPYIKDETEVARVAKRLLTDSVEAETLGRNLRELIGQLDLPGDPAHRAAKLAMDLIV